MQATLDYAVSTAARGVQVGATQGTAGESTATLAAAAVCPAVNGMLGCGNIVVSVVPVPPGADYYSNTAAPTLSAAGVAGGLVCTGAPGQMMLLSAWYLGPSFLGMLIPGFTTVYNKISYHITAASSGFVNELFKGGQTQGSGC